nr:VWA domain-containing protein [Acidobacteriota bacterium]
MRRVRIAAVCSAALAAAGLLAQEPPPTQAQQRPTFRGGARFVRVDVFPTGKDGKPIEGLTAADFEVFEDGKPQAIDTFDFVRVEPELEGMRIDPNTQKEGEEMARDPRARLFVFVLDTRHVDLEASRRMRRPLADMVDRLLGPRDMFGIITPQLRPSDLILGRKSATADDMMTRYWTWGVSDNIVPQDSVEQLVESCFGSITSINGAITRELIARHREKQTLDHLAGLVEKVGGLRDERKAIIVVSQGWRLFARDENMLRTNGAAAPPITGSGGRVRIGADPMTGMIAGSDCYEQARSLWNVDSPAFFRELLRKAQRANVAFYPIDPRGLAPFDTPISHGAVRAPTIELSRLAERADGLRTLAENTDGIALLMNNDLGSQLRKLADSLSTYYLLGYYSTNTKFDGGYRRLEVKVRRSDVRVRARRGYLAPTQEEIDGIAARREVASRPPSAEALMLGGALGRLNEVRHDRDLFVQA